MSASMKPDAAHRARWLAITALAAIALTVLERELRSYRYHDLMRQVWTLPHSQLALALILTVFGYAVLPGYDAIALRYD